MHHPPRIDPVPHLPDYDYDYYDSGLKSGPEFLDEVSGIIGGSEAAGLPPHITNDFLGGTLLQNIQHKVRSELSRGPPNHVRSHVQIGIVPHAAKAVLPHQPPKFGRNAAFKRRKRPRNRLPHVPYSSSNQDIITSKKTSNKVAKAVKSIKGDPDSVSFSELMADFLTANPLPFKDAKKSTKKTNKKTWETGYKCLLK